MAPGAGAKGLKKDISVVIPAYNERQHIGDTVKAVHSIPGVSEVIVVDDGSTDGTGAVAGAGGAKVLTLTRNGGKGRALARGISSASNDIILFLDADLGNTADQGERLLDPLLAGEADMTIGIFPTARSRAGLGMALGLARYGTWLLTGVTFQAPLSGQRGFTRRALEKLQPLLPRFGVEIGLNVRAVQGGLRIVEIPVSMKHRSGGLNISGFCHRGRQFWHILLALAHLHRKG